MKWRLLGATMVVLLLHITDPSAEEIPSAVKGLTFESCIHQNIPFFVVRLRPDMVTLDLFWKDAAGTPYGSFTTLRSGLEARGRTLVFATNSGIYAKDNTPLGLHVEAEKTLEPLNRKQGGGNFFLKPNGVFYVDGNKAGLLETEEFYDAGVKPRLAVQSGPLLIHHNAYHPKLLPDAETRYVRNGVGLLGDGTVVFALAEQPVNFFTFAHFCGESLHCTDLLYLDGTLSDIYAPEAGRTGPGLASAGILAVTAPAAGEGR